MLITSIYCSIAQENDCHNLNINVGSDFQLKIESLSNNSIVAKRNSNEKRFYKTCNEMKAFKPDALSGMYTLNPSDNNYVTVFCNVTDKFAITTIRHNIQDEINIKGFKEHFSYAKHVEYEIPSDYIREIINSHLYCRQFIKYRCKGSMLLKSSDQWGYWASQDNTRRNYWGGSTKDNYCACGMTGTCINKSYKCNCDQNSESITTSDEGFLEKKDHLPVGYLRFGDTDAPGENGWYQLGPLECF